MVTLIKQDFLENKKLYNEIEKSLRKYLDISIPITHVGSTAIPDICGKNIIDVLIGAKDEKQFEEISKILENRGFYSSAKSKTEVYQFFSSKDTEAGSGDVHIHLVISNTERYAEFIVLKEYLLNNKVEAQNYSNFKKKIIDDGIRERKEYKTVKSVYVTDLITRAKSWYEEEK